MQYGNVHETLHFDCNPAIFFLSGNNLFCS